MHPFSELAARCASMTASSARDAQSFTLGELEKSGRTVWVKSLQAIELQRMMTAVGLVSMFEAALQRALGESDGFIAARAVLRDSGHATLEADFADLLRAINVLKHGAGRSHNELLARRDLLPFRVRAEGEFFEEGDVSELDFLVRADEEFFHYCAAVVDEVASKIRELKPEVIL